MRTAEQYILKKKFMAKRSFEKEMEKILHIVYYDSRFTTSQLSSSRFGGGGEVHKRIMRLTQCNTQWSVYGGYLNGNIEGKQFEKSVDEADILILNCEVEAYEPEPNLGFITLNEHINNGAKHNRRIKKYVLKGSVYNFPEAKKISDIFEIWNKK